MVGGAMVEAQAGPRPSRVTQLLEKTLRQLLEHPSVFSYSALAISTVIALYDGPESLRTGLAGLVLLILFSGWLQLWARRRAKDPTAQSPWTMALAIAGMLLLASLTAMHLSFTIVATTLLPQYFASLPFPIAVLAFSPMFVAAEHSHRMAVLAHPAGFPWTMAFIRGTAVVLVGGCFRVLAMQMAEQARLQSSLASADRKAGMLEERQRLAREIHDTLAQGFASIIVHFERAEQTDSLLSSPARPHLNLARSVAHEGLEDARRMLAALRPEILEQRALPEALGRVCEEWSRRTGIGAKLSITGMPAPMHPDIELTILRAVQEALTNVARHAGARTAAVTLSYMEDVLVLDVQDDGKGFAPLTTAGRGFGLAGMRERAEALQGSFSVESVPDEGTTVSISLPVLRSAATDLGAEGLAT